MIEKINIKLNTKNIFNKSAQKDNTTENTHLPSPSPSLLHSYFVSFGQKKDGAEKTGRAEKIATILNNMNDPAQELLNDSQKIAKEYGHAEVDRIHVLRAG